MSHGGFTEGVEVSQAWNKTGEELGFFGGGVQIAVLTAGEKATPRFASRRFCKKCRKVPVNPGS